jgi:rhamnose transport system ATP-binding protein
MSRLILQLSGIHKNFGGVPALRGANLEVHAGEILGLVGENGAGKSTLINVSTGLFKPDGGDIRLDGNLVSLNSPRAAAALGIAVVHQESDLFPQLTIAENMLLARKLVRDPFGFVRWNDTYREAHAMVAALGESFDVREPASGLPVARRMMSELAAAVSENANVLFLDEPTSSLTVKEIENLFARVRALRDKGVAIVYVSHRLEEILDLCDRVTIMRDGETIETRPANELTMQSIVASMVGREMSKLQIKRIVPIRDVRLRVENLCAGDDAFRNISLEARAGEIVGIYGFVGAGRSEFGQALFGLHSVASGTVSVDGKAFTPKSPGAAIAHGLAYLPEDRLVQGVFRSHSVRSNASVPSLRSLSVAGLISNRRETALVRDVIRDMAVKCNSPEQPVVTLSGGNQQKVVFGRWMATAPKVLVLDEPTRGVDVGAKAEIHKLICDMAEAGAAIVLISSELPEIMAMSDRVITLSEGKKTGEFDPKRDSQSTIAQAAVPISNAQYELTHTDGQSGIWRYIQFREVGLIASIAVLCAVMTALRPDGFANAQNILDILASAAIPCIVAQGAMLVICAGGIDISVGSMVGLISALASMAAVNGAPPLLCLALAIALGTVFSAINAATALIARIHPIIVTLAGISIYRGLMRITMGGREIYSLPEGFRALADGNVLGIPKVCYYVIAVTIVIHIFLRYRLTGRQILALGNSESASRLIGLSKTRLSLTAFAISGALVGMTSVLIVAYYGRVQANTGEGLELKAIAAAVIGGTNILGGRGSAFGTLLGAFLVALLYNSLVLLQASSYWQDAFVGALILGAVVVDQVLQRMREHRR